MKKRPIICTFFLLSMISFACLQSSENKQQDAASSVPQATATLSVTSLSPAENSVVDNNSTLSFTYSYVIQNREAGKQYQMMVWLYDTNTNVSFGTYSFNLTADSGTVTNTFSGSLFYNCFITCSSRKTALPWRVTFKIQSTDLKELGKSREYIYN